MKKVTMSIVMLTQALLAFSQMSVSSKTFDLESIDRHRGWKLYTGFASPEGNTVIKIGQPECDQETKNGIVTTKGLSWSFEELHFDADLNYLKTDSKNFPNTIDALQYESVWGKTFNVMNISLSAGAALNGLTGNDFGQEFIMTTANVTGGTKISLARVESEAKGIMNKQGTAAVGCNQFPVLNILSTESAKDLKGQKWMHIKSFPQRNHAVALFQVDGEGYPKGKMNYVLRKYNGNLEVDKNLHMVFEYNNAMQIVEVANAAGTKDYILVSQTSDKYAPKGLPVKEADYAEVIYVDGNSLEIKFQEAIKLPYSKWYVRESIATNDGSVVVFGPAGSDNKSYLEMPGSALSIADAKVFKNIINDPKNSPNLLSLKISRGKVESLIANTVEDAKKVSQVVAGSAKKSKGVPIYNYPSTVENANAFSVINKSNRRIYYKNDKIIVCYQALIEGSTSKPPVLGDMTVAVFDNSGKVEKFFMIPEDEYANYEEFFSADDKKMYWLTYNYSMLNKEIAPSVYEGKKVPGMVATIPSISVIDFSANTASNVQAITAPEWGIDASRPVVVNTDKEIVFQGKSTAKKAKDSELVLVKVSK